MVFVDVDEPGAAAETAADVGSMMDLRAFTPRTVEQLRPRVEELVDDRLRALRPRGGADLMSELALPLPVAVICEVLGVPEEERPTFLT